jgi:hypothetical protein
MGISSFCEEKEILEVNKPGPQTDIPDWVCLAAVKRMGRLEPKSGSIVSDKFTNREHRGLEIKSKDTIEELRYPGSSFVHAGMSG